MKQKEFNNLAKKQIENQLPGSATQAWKRGYLYAMNKIQELFGTEIEEISCLEDLTEMIDDAEELHE